MRLVVTSDLHYDEAGHLTAPDAVETLAKRVASERPDALVLAGDLGHGVENFRRCVSCFLGTAPQIGVLAGNHDVWRDERLGHGSEALLRRVLPALCTDLGVTWLEQGSLRVGDVAIAGSMAWYDYSAIDPEQRHLIDQVATLKSMLNNDAHWINWPQSDVEIARELGDGLCARVASAAADSAVRAVAVVTHVPLLEGQMVRKPRNASWGLSNAFFGNLTLGARLIAEPKVAAILSGHSHFGREGQLARPHGGPLRYSVVPSDYGDPRHIRVDL